MTVVRFHQALQGAAVALASPIVPSDGSVRLIRDIFGRVRFAIDIAQAECPPELRTHLEKAQQSLGRYASAPDLIFRESFAFPDAVFGAPDWHRTIVPLGHDEEGISRGEVELQLLDRQVTGHDWLLPVDEDDAHRPHRIVFFGLKGGVGRSTALCMTAWGLARQGKSVLLIDLDLESPGLSGLVLPPERVAEFGVMDWLIEDAVGQGQTVLGSMVSASPLGETTEGAIRVAAAMGQGESDYLAKLARAYADAPGPHGPLRMGARLRRMVEELEAKESPDVVLIDSRAGLHDLAAAAITGLADTALLFATDNAQTWQGYAQLFTHWQRRPDVVRHVRERLALVRALTPKRDREDGVKLFHRKAYELFANCLYDSIPPNSPEAQSDYFHPIEGDEAAPHFPILVDWDEMFQEFDPSLRPEKGGASEAKIQSAFGALIGWVTQRVEGASK